jgi:hypothetical protein
MCAYKSIAISHSIWTGKPQENIKSILNYHGQFNWRRIAINTESKGSKSYSELILETVVSIKYYKKHPMKPLPFDYNPDDFA